MPGCIFRTLKHGLTTLSSLAYDLVASLCSVRGLAAHWQPRTSIYENSSRCFKERKLKAQPSE